MRVDINTDSPAAPRQLTILMICLLAAMGLSAIDRTDANWDLQNYHLYAPYALLHGSLGHDFFAAGFQGYLNPAADIPYYVIKMIVFPAHPVLVAAIAGLPFGLLVFCVFNIARYLLPSYGYWVWGGTTLLGVTGATCLSEVGTTYDDILMADFILLSVWMLLKDGGFSAVALAGLFGGVAVGLKFTAAVFAPGLFVLALLMMPNPKALALFAVGAVIGFLAVWGWWGMLLWQHFGNPFFPMLGALFPATAVPGFNVHDTNFYPKTLVQWLFYPFFWLQGRAFVVAEEPLRDPRFAFVYLAFAVSVIVWLVRKSIRPTRNLSGVYLFFGLSYALWLSVFSILRYALPLEVLTGVVIFGLLSPLLSKRVSVAGLVVLLAVVIIVTKPMGWGRISYNKTLIEQPLPQIPDHAVVLVSGAPIGFVIPYLHATDAEFDAVFWISPGTAEFAHVQKSLTAAADVELLTNTGRDAQSIAAENSKLALFGKTYDDQSCLPINSPIQKYIRLCKLADINHG